MSNVIVATSTNSKSRKIPVLALIIFLAINATALFAPNNPNLDVKIDEGLIRGIDSYSFGELKREPGGLPCTSGGSSCNGYTK